jgi:hypothetical protein
MKVDDYIDKLEKAMVEDYKNPEWRYRIFCLLWQDIGYLEDLKRRWPSAWVACANKEYYESR